MDDARTVLPISGIVINQLEIDTVDAEYSVGVCLTPQDIQRGYQRWKTMLGAPDPLRHEYTDPAALNLVRQLAAAEKEVTELQAAVETQKARNLTLVSDVAEREKTIRALEASKTDLENDKATLARLAQNREIEIKNLTGINTNLTRRIERYQRRYRTADQRLNPVQRFVSWLFRI